MRRAFAVLAGAWLACAPHLAAGADTLTILHLNDFHGELLPHRSGAGQPELGGAARLAATVGAERTGSTLFLAAGDLMAGAPVSSMFDGAPAIEVLTIMGLDASAVGNHEFDDGRAVLAERAAEAGFPFLAANIRGEGPWVPEAVRQVGRVRVGLFGLTTVETPEATHPRNVEGLVFEDPVEAARRAVESLRGRADLVVALTHLGLREDERLAAEVPGIDVIVGGHTHTRVEEPIRVGETLILQAFERGAALGRLDLLVDRGRIRGHAYRLIPVTVEAGEDPAVADLVEHYRRELGSRMDEVVGTALADLDGAKERVRRVGTGLGRLVADVVREAAGAEVAVVNGGTIRASIPAGPVTVGAVHAALPFDNWVVAFPLTGRELLEALEVGVSRVEEGDGGFPQVSGMAFAYEPAAAPGKRVREVTVGGSPLEEERRYVVATHDFLAAGGNGYTVFSGREPVFADSGRLLRDLVVDWWRARGEVAPAPPGRVTRLP